MIRKFTPDDPEELAALWLQSNRDAHPFIPVSFWQDHLAGLRSALPEAEVLVHTAAGSTGSSA